MNKRGTKWLGLGILLTLLLIAGMFFYIAFTAPTYDRTYQEKEDAGFITNPLSGLTISEAVKEFDDSSVYYLLISLKAYNLHSASERSDLPELDIVIDGTIYHAIIAGGKIIVKKEAGEKRDIIITTTQEEAIKMIQNEKYIPQSFNAGLSTIEQVADKSTLLFKGYYTFETHITGTSITGNVIRSYFY